MEIKEIICTSCPLGCMIQATLRDGKIKNVEGHGCPKGAAYAKEEIYQPMRMLTSTVALVGRNQPRLSVKTSQPIDKGKIFAVMAEIKGIRLYGPVHLGQMILEDVAGTGVDIVATAEA